MSHPNKTVVLVATVCVGITWLFMLSLLLLLIALVIGLVFGMPNQITISRRTGHLILAAFGLFIFVGIVYFALALSVRCPRCGHSFLKNPKGLGPSGFIYNAQCPRLRGVGPWAYQIGRFLGTRKICCIKCGEEVFDGDKQMP
jgi:hypothetical protein